MAKQAINTVSVSITANSLKGINDTISRECQTTRGTVRGLAGSWSSPATAAAMDKANTLFGFEDERYLAMQQYIDFLNSLVIAEYKAVEEYNTSLKDKFK